MDKVNIRVFDRNINFLGEVDNYTSLFFIRKWNTYGEFEFHITKHNKELFKRGNIIMLGNDGYRTGVIEYVEDNEDESKDIIVKGFGLLYYLTLRITVPPTNLAYDVYNTNIETIMYSLVDKNAINTNDANRKIELLENGVNNSKGGNLNFQTRYKVLDEELSKLSNHGGLGVNIRLDYKNKKLVFEVLEGVDRSYYQDKNSSVIFSKKYDNISKRNYIESDIGYKNVGYVAGQGEGADRELVVINNTLTGIDRRETFIDARDIEEGESLSLVDRGKVKLSENAQVKTFACEVNARDYKKTWDLGDTVTIKDDELGLAQDYRITEVKEIYEIDGNRVETTFGISMPTLVDKVKQINDAPIAEASGGLKDLSVTVNGTTYSQNNGNITLPNYPKNSYNAKRLIDNTGWRTLFEFDYRDITSSEFAVGASFLLQIDRQFSYINNETYVFLIVASYYNVKIVQLAGVTNAQLLKKIRVVTSTSIGSAKIEAYIEGTALNGWNSTLSNISSHTDIRVIERMYEVSDNNGTVRAEHTVVSNGCVS